MRKLKVLLLAANPSGTTKLALDEEARSIGEKVRLAEYRDSIELVAGFATRPDDLIQLLNVHKPHVVHFSGHGRSGGIYLTNDNGRPKLVSTSTLTALFRTLKDNIRVVLLNSCHSETQATAITAHIDVCIGMGISVDDKTAIAFAASFYRALAFGRSIEGAFEQGRVAIMLAGLHESDAPKLLTRAGVNPQRLVLVSVPDSQGPHLPDPAPQLSPAAQPPAGQVSPPTSSTGPSPSESRAELQPTDDDIVHHEPVPRASMRLYRLLWQLENWLRTLVYVELRASRSDWDDLAKSHIAPPFAASSADSALPHVATPHLAALSSLTFADLSRIVLDASTWPLFEPYFPPRRNTEVRLEEIAAVRERVVCFHEPRAQDEARLALFLQEVDRGLQRFCLRYSTGKIPRGPVDDPVTEYLSERWTRMGYGIELHRPNLDWLYAPPPYRGTPQLAARLQLLTHSKYEAGSPAGVIYRLTCHPMGEEDINFEDFLQSTQEAHVDVIHIVASPVADDITVTIPAMLGVERTGRLLGAFLSAARDCRRTRSRRRVKKNLEWPQYVIWPSDSLAFFMAGYSGPAFEYESGESA